MKSSYHGTVRKEDQLWVYRVFGNWTTKSPVLIARGSYRDWLTTYTQAAGTVSAFQSMYEYRSGERDRR